MHRLLLVAVAIAAVPAHADAPRLGGMVAVRAVDLAGQIVSDPDVGFSIAGVAELPPVEGLTAAIEPGLSLSGSGKYRLAYIAAPIVARMRFATSRRVRVRVTAGFVPAVLAWASLRDSEGTSIRDHVRPRDVTVMGGGGIEVGQFFAELRVARGVVTVHAEDPGLFILNEEIGLWLGIQR